MPVATGRGDIVRVLVTTLFVVLGACSQRARQTSRPADTLVGPGGTRAEEAWVLSDVAGHIARWREEGPASIPQATLIEPGGTPRSYRVQMPGRAVTIALRDHLWSPPALAPLVRTPSLPRTTSCESSDVMEPLLTPTVRTLVEVDERISERIRDHPPEPCAHEAAALLLGAFQIREAWSTFADARPALARMAAHLAIAHALRSGAAPGPEGRIANLLLLAIAWRHDGFPDLLRDRAAIAREPERTWLRVISLYSVQDWRELADPAAATFAERLTYLNALANKTDANRVLDFLDRGAKERTADWSRFVFQRHVSVEVCGRFGESGPAMILQEIQDAYRHVRGRELPEDRLVSALNEEADDDAARRVLDWPLWAGLEQRNLLASLRGSHECLRDVYGTTRPAADYAEAISARFGTLRLYPLLRHHVASTASEYRRALTDASRLLRTRPNLVTWGSWVELWWPAPHLGTLPAGLPAPEPWFTPRLPFGTAFDYNSRLADRTRHFTKDLTLLDEARRHVFHVLARRLYAEGKYGAKPPVSELRLLYGRAIEFDRDALLSVSKSARDRDASEYLRAVRGLCELSVDDCHMVAEYLRDHGDAGGAAREFQRWADGGRDRVAISNNIEWLVNYYFDRGQPQKALELARAAADVHSSGGLETMARLLERMGRLTEAEKYFRLNHERYDSGVSALVEFLVRHQDHPGMEASLGRVVTDVFPGGQRPAQKGEFVASRPAGALVGSLSDAPGDSVGLVVGDVVVGVDGVRVSGLGQLRVQGRLSTTPEASVMYWRHGIILESRVSRLGLREYGFAPDPVR